MEKFLYLGSPSFVPAWIAGGQVPLNLASFYLSEERDATKTPDETKKYSANFDIEPISKYIKMEQVKNLHFYGTHVDGKRIGDGTIFHHDIEDGIILSLCNSLSDAIGRGLKKKAVVKILDVESLKQSLDAQIGIKSEARNCEYTDRNERNHFLKSTKDAWQEEFRLFWPAPGPRKVLIPSSTANFERYI